MRIAITGATGFIGRNLCVRLGELAFGEILPITRSTSEVERAALLVSADAVVHLAGVNRPTDDAEFAGGNIDATVKLCETLSATGRPIPVIFTSSIQADIDNPYGRSKRQAEEVILRYSAETGSRVALLRLVNVFGKWCRPHYNSAVATFCHNIARDLPITVSRADAPLRLIHIDAVTDAITSLLRDGSIVGGMVETGPVYETTVGAVAESIRDFAASRQTLNTGRVGTGLLRALYSTYVSYLPPESFSYPLTRHEDPRGVFAEFLRTPDAGQVSFFSAHPGVTRGGHYHHTKTEKFLVVKGSARFAFRHVITDERREITVQGTEARVVETVPGWAHDITNIGTDEMFVLLWANEVFDRNAPDTIAAEVAV